MFTIKDALSILGISKVPGVSQCVILTAALIIKELREIKDLLGQVNNPT